MPSTPPPTAPLPPPPATRIHVRAESEMSEGSIFSDVELGTTQPTGTIEHKPIDATYDTFEITRTQFQQAADLHYYKNEQVKRSMKTPAFQIYTRDQATQTEPRPLHQRRKFTISEIRDLTILN